MTFVLQHPFHLILSMDKTAPHPFSLAVLAHVFSNTSILDLPLWTTLLLSTFYLCFIYIGDFCIDGSGSENLDSPDPLTTPATPDPENSYQCLKWLPFKPDECCIMYDDASQRM